jgi:nucleoside-diphosphate-sugar epimerase
VLRAVQDRGLNAVIIRPGNIFGPGAEKVAPYGVFAFGNRWMIMGSGKALLPLVYIDDVVDALVRAAECETVRGPILNLVDPEQIEQRDYLRYVRSSIPEISMYRVPMPVLYGVAVPLELLGKILGRGVPLTNYRLRSIKSRIHFNCAAARDLLGWEPPVGVREGLRRTFGTPSVQLNPARVLSPQVGARK